MTSAKYNIEAKNAAPISFIFTAFSENLSQLQINKLSGIFGCHRDGISIA